MAAQGAHNPSSKAGKSNPRSGRLLRHSDFERVYKQGRRHFSAHMTVFYLRRAEGEGLRVGFTVGRVLGGAVDRNRIKRRLRESVRIADGYDALVVMAMLESEHAAIVSGRAPTLA